MRTFLKRHLVALGQRLPPLLRAPLQRIWRASATEPNLKREQISGTSQEYLAQLAAETAIFEGQTIVHDLPAIYHYWSNKYLRPQMESFGFSNPDEFFAFYLQKSFVDSGARPARFVSLGCGNCDTEVRVARMLVDKGITQFTLECVDINATMLDRGMQLAVSAGVAAQIVPMRGDFNHWQPHGQYAAIMANQSLHHVVELEQLFTAIGTALAPHGRFITADIIGRNGHQLWPEAMSVLREYWSQLPSKCRYNVQLRRQEDEFADWDCSKEGFEGIRAQDILPLLIERFDFELFIGFANIIDPFIGRSFGPNLDVDSAEDRAFIDRVHARDQAEIMSGRIKPTHITAVMRQRPYAQQQCWQHLTPEFCVRVPT